MVTTFNKKDIVEFGNYLLSDERKNRTRETCQDAVTHADIENWLEIKKHKGSLPVLAKFVVDSVQDDDAYEVTNVMMNPVIEGSEENKSFSKYTPSGQIMLGVSYDTEASNYFEQGEEYYVKFTKVNK